MFKKAICILCVALMLFSLCGCQLINPNKAEKYITSSNELLEKGKLKEALCKLYEGKEALGENEEINNAIDDYFKKVTFSCTISPDEVDKEYRFVDTTFTKDYYNDYKDIGLILTHNESGKKETVACIEILFDFDFMPTSDEYLANIDDNIGDTWTFHIYTGPSAPCSFMYTIHSNRFTVLKGTPTNIIAYDDMFLGQTFGYAVGNEVSLYSYNTNGKVLYEKNDIILSYFDKEKKPDIIFFASAQYGSILTTYKIYSMKPDGSDEKPVCTIEVLNGYLYIEGSTAIWEENGKEHSMDLNKPHDVTV